MIINYFKYVFNHILRKLYWFVRLNKIKLGKSSSLEFPLKIEGKGVIIIGEKARLKKLVNLGVSDKGELVIGTKCHLENEATVLIGKSCQLLVGNDFKLGRNSRLFVKNNWTFGNDVKIETYCSIFAREPDNCGRLIIGDGSHIGDYTIIDVVADVRIGNEVAIGPNCTIYTHDHIYSNSEIAAWKGGITSSEVIIGDGAWVGSNVTILPGVTIGDRAVIASGAVVTKSVEPNTVNAGIPAKCIKRIS